MTRERERIQRVYERRMEASVADRYTLSNPGERFMREGRDTAILRALAGAGVGDLAGLDILEVGCGAGQGLLDWAQWGASPKRVAGIDLMAPLLARARAASPMSLLVRASVDQLPFPDHAFDVVAQRTVFTSILDANMRRSAAAEMARVLRPNGTVIWYDFRYPSPCNRDVRAIGSAELRRLFPGWRAEITSVTLLPPIARALAPASPVACRLIERLAPPLRSHLVAALRPPALT